MIFFFLSCNKANDWLNEPRSKRDIIFSTLNDYQDLLNNTSVFNLPLSTIGIIGSDNLIVRDQAIQSISVIERNAYLWNKDIYEDKTSFEYNFGYQAINYSNIVISGIEELGRNVENAKEFDFIKGQAHFFRAYFYFELASLFCKPFVLETSKIDKGLSLRISPDINEILKRATIFDTYKLILNDAEIAVNLLPESTKFKSQPSKSAARLLLARIYLNMSDYENAWKYADLCLNNNRALIDFNEIPSLNLPFRFPDFNGVNAEILFYAQGSLYQSTVASDNLAISLVDTTFFRQYDLDDLRRVYYYREFDSVSVKFKGGYTGGISNFCGLATNEAILIRAETNVRLGRLEDALNDLNRLLRARYKRGTYVEHISSDPDSLLRKVLLERRKELPFTGNIRWQDLRRLNLDPRLATSIFRKVNGILKELKPNDNLYVLPIPQSEINLAGLEQNER